MQCACLVSDVLEPFPKPTYMLTSKPKQLQKAIAGSLQPFVINRAIQKGAPLARQQQRQQRERLDPRRLAR